MSQQTRVMTLEEAEKAFKHWADRVWDGLGQPIIIEKEHAGRAAEALFGSIDAIREES